MIAPGAEVPTDSDLYAVKPEFALLVAGAQSPAQGRMEVALRANGDVVALVVAVRHRYGKPVLAAQPAGQLLKLRRPEPQIDGTYLRGIVPRHHKLGTHCALACLFALAFIIKEFDDVQAAGLRRLVPGLTDLGLEQALRPTGMAGVGLASAKKTAAAAHLLNSFA